MGNCAEKIQSRPGPWVATALGLGLVLMACGQGAAPAPVRVVSLGIEGPGPVVPTATIVVTLSAPIIPETVGPETVMILEGQMPSGVSHALERGAPLAAAAGQVGIVTDVDAAGRLILVPRRAFRPGTLHTLALGGLLGGSGGRLGRGVAAAFRTGSLDDAAPVLGLLEPGPGAAGVVRNLRRVRGRYSHAVSHPERAWVVDGAGRAVAARVAPVRCETSCVEWVLHEVLDADRRYELVADRSVLDADGRPVFGREPGFSTGAVLRHTPIQMSEVRVTASDGCVVASFATREPAVGELCSRQVCTLDGPSFAHELALELGPGERSPERVELGAYDESTRPVTSVPGAPVEDASAIELEISEVLFRPRGGLRAQQFVELRNRGAGPVELAGMIFEDESGSDTLGPALIGPGQRAVIVPSGYREDSGDGEIAEGAVVSRLRGATLGSGGLRLGGERVALREPSGARVSTFLGAGAATFEGQSLVRTGRCPVSGSFSPSPTGRASPGAD